MKQTTKNLYIIGLALFLFGETIGIMKIIKEALSLIFRTPSSEANASYVPDSALLAHIVPIIIKLIIAFIIVFMITCILKNIKSKCLIPLLCCSIVFIILIISSSSTFTIPKYLIISKWGLIDTIWVYFINYLTNGTIFSIVSYIIILIAIMQTLKQKKKGAEMDG